LSFIEVSGVNYCIQRSTYLPAMYFLISRTNKLVLLSLSGKFQSKSFYSSNWFLLEEEEEEGIYLVQKQQ